MTESNDPSAAAALAVPTEIEPGLWQSGWPGPDLCVHKRIESVINLVPFMQAEQFYGRHLPEYGKVIIVRMFPYLDLPGSQPPADWMQSVGEAILKELTRGPTLVHCLAGWNRSTIAIGAALRLRHGWDGVRALSTIQALRPVKPQPRWSQALIDWQPKELPRP